MTTTVKELIKKTGFTNKQFAEYFHIPLRTIEQWKSENRKCNSYIIELMVYKLVNEGIISED